MTTNHTTENQRPRYNYQPETGAVYDDSGSGEPIAVFNDAQAASLFIAAPTLAEDNVRLRAALRDARALAESDDTSADILAAVLLELADLADAL